jgi:hypothetical protein
MRFSLPLVTGRYHFVTLIGVILFGLTFFPPASQASSERLLSFHIGPSWPLKTGSAWNAAVMFGTFIDKQVGFGLSGDFLWHTKTWEKDSTNSEDRVVGTYTTKNESSYMFPVTGFFIFDPIPEQMVHPVVKFEIGYNSMVYNFTERVPNPAEVPMRTGYYYGLIIKAGIDGLYDVGEQVAIFAGLDYQWAETKSMKDKVSGLFSHRDMGGAGLHIGCRLLY